MPGTTGVPARKTTPSTTGLPGGRSAGGSAASGHATAALQSRPASGRLSSSILSRIGGMGKATTDAARKADAAVTPTRIGALPATSVKGGRGVSPKGSPNSSSPSVVPGRAIPVSRGVDRADLPASNLASGGLLSGAKTKPVVASALASAAEVGTDQSLSPIHQRPMPQLPSQRQGHHASSGVYSAGSRVTATLGGLRRDVQPPAHDYSGTVADDQNDGYTYMPIQQDYPGLKQISAEPPIYTVTDFLTSDECDSLIETAGPLLQRSKTHAAAGSEATKGRTSLTCHLAKKIYPCPVMLQKIQNLTNKPFGHMELPQVARYASSQRYVEHYDGVDPHTEAGRAFCASGGQRVATVLMYLNEVSDGGATRFKRLNIEVKPKKGMALVFFPGFMNGELDTDALHAGMPAVDTKWVSQVWIRQSFREDGQPSTAVPIEEQSLVGPLHEGLYKGLSIAGNDVHEAIMTFDEAKAFAAKLPHCQGFTYESKDRYPTEPTRVWFKSRIEVLYNEDWWTWSTGFGM